MAIQEEIKPEDLRDARELIQSMLKAKKNLRLYPPNNPMYGKVVDAAYAKINDVLQVRDKMELKISRNEILIVNEPVYHSEGKDDNLALFFFRDGLRTLIFEKDLSPLEFREFLEIITVDFESEVVEEDLVTLLWEKDFQHIKYTVDEASMLEDEDYEEKAVKEAKDGSMEEDNLQHAYSDAVNAEDVKDVPPVPITQEDLKALASEMSRNAADKVKKLTDILFDMLYLAETFDEFKDITRIINNSVEFSIRNANILSAAQILHRTYELLSKSKNKELKKHLGMVFTNAGSPTAVKALGVHLDSKEGVNEKLFARYVSYLSVNAIPSFISLLGELESIGGRKNTINALAILGKKDLNTLMKGLRDSRWFVVRNIIHALRLIKDNRAIDPLIKTASHPDARVQKEIIKTLGELGGDKAVGTIELFIDNPDKNMRLAAAHALGATGSDLAKIIIIRKLSDRKTQSSDFDEIKEYFEVLTRWKDDEVLDFILRVIARNPFFGRSKYNTYKAGAAHALGFLGNRETAEVLDKLRSSKHALLSEHAYASLKRIKYARK